VIEINGRDRPGLLYELTHALSAQQLQIASALVTTYGETAVDVFYVKDLFGLQIRHDGKLARIRDALLEVLGGAANGSAVPAVKGASPAPESRPQVGA
jgi:[protein-PII] uridylyltransferase